MQSALRCSNLGESSARITLHLLELNRSGKSLPGNALAQRLLDDNSTRSLPSGSAPPELMGGGGVDFWCLKKRELSVRRR